MILSCFVGYNGTFKAYIIYILVHRNTMVSKEVKFDEDMCSSRSQVSPLVIELSEEVFVP